jgi:hypothetical protein
MVVLPHGYSYGRLDGALAKEVLAAADLGRVVLEGCRGRSTWARPGQAAELAVRSLLGEARADVLAAGPAEHAGPAPEPGSDAQDAWTVRVDHADGRAWLVRVAQRADPRPRPESCGAVFGTPARMDVESVRALPASGSGDGVPDRR